MSIRSKKIKLIKKIYPRYGLLDTDIILATFPKSGTTWFRFIYANTISLLDLDGIEVDYTILNEKINSSFDGHIYPKIKYTSLPRLVATHRKYDAKSFGKNNIIFLYRNPFDTLTSYWEYFKNKANFKGYINFNQFIQSETFGIPAWIKHYNSWIDIADIAITYEEMKKNDFNTFKKIISYFKLPVNDDTIISALERSKFKKIREIEDSKGLNSFAKNEFKNGFKFARKGKVGEGINNFSEEEIEFVRNELAKNKIYLNNLL